MGIGQAEQAADKEDRAWRSHSFFLPPFEANLHELKVPKIQY
jgi:hypothetical protein